MKFVCFRGGGGGGQRQELGAGTDLTPPPPPIHGLNLQMPNVFHLKQSQARRSISREKNLKKTCISKFKFKLIEISHWNQKNTG